MMMKLLIVASCLLLAVTNGFTASSFNKKASTSLNVGKYVSLAPAAASNKEIWGAGIWGGSANPTAQVASSAAAAKKSVTQTKKSLTPTSNSNRTPLVVKGAVAKLAEQKTVKFFWD
jgi:hypothetical protein